MNDANMVVVSGRLARDMEIKALQSGTQLGTFTIGSKRYVPGKNGAQGTEETQWLDCKLWKPAQFLVNLLKQGNWVSLIGRLEKETWGGENGTKKQSRVVVTIEQVVNVVAKTGSIGQVSGNNYQQPRQQAQTAPVQQSRSGAVHPADDDWDFPDTRPTNAGAGGPEDFDDSDIPF